MAKYLRKFETTADYESAKDSLILPNVSLCEDNNVVYYEPYVPPFFCKLTLNNGNVVELEGSGELTSAMTSSYKSTLVSAEIGTLCTSIGERAFRYCSSLISIDIPSGVTSIGNNAFEYCGAITSCTIGSGVTSIGTFAFHQCLNLTSIYIPSGVTSIGQSPFNDCGITSITVDNNNTVFDSRNNCNAIIRTSTNELIQGCKNTVIPNSVTSIGNAAFISCTSLTSITIPSSVTSIGSSAFQYCDSLTSVTIPNSVTSIGNYAFAYCSSLTSYTIGNGVTSIGTYAFNGCSSLSTIISRIMSAPSVGGGTFQGVKTGGTLYVPIGSSGYETWMNNQGNLGMYNWTKVEQ